MSQSFTLIFLNKKELTLYAKCTKLSMGVKLTQLLNKMLRLILQENSFEFNGRNYL